MRNTLVFSLLGLCFLGACGGEAVAPPSVPASPAGSTNAGNHAPRLDVSKNAPVLRLAHDVNPTRYEAKLTITPTEEAFTGEIAISLDVKNPTSVVWLNAVELEMGAATLERGTEKTAARIVPANQFTGFAFDEAVPQGPAVLRIAYKGKLRMHEAKGAYRQDEGGDSYVFTQFESIDARRAFPCFDEPSWKTPWQLTLDVPAKDAAFANTPELVAATAAPPPTSPGRKIVQFAPSKPIPSYLVAFAVGPFEVVDGGRAGLNSTPIRIIVPRGKTAEAKYAAATTGEVLTRLETYFGIAYPYEKLDHVAVPMKGGAMENPGLVTYGTTTMLGRNDEDSLRLRRGYIHIAAHELAHQWFGDLVTATWWDDLWLNEAFATWADAKIVDAWKPEWDGSVAKVQSRTGAMGNDSLASARRIREPITSDNDIANAFDGITYSKGAAVIAMFESWIGADAFRGAVKSYLTSHAYGSGTAADFLAAVAGTGEAGKVAAAAMPSFLDQPGVPLVTANLVCDARGAKLTLAQTRFRPLGSTATEGSRWQVPVCAKYPGHKGEARACTMLTDATGELALPETKGCPAWVQPNAEAIGYYRVEYGTGMLQQLLGAGIAHLSVAERVDLVSDINALVFAGRLSNDAALALVPALSKDKSRHVVAATVNIVAGVSDHLVGDAARPNYRRFVEKMYGARARQLGWTAKPGETEDTALLRQSMVPFVVEETGDATLVAEAKKVAARWLDDRSGVNADLVGAVLSAASRSGDEAWFERLHQAAKKSEDRRDRGRILSALGSFLEPSMVERGFRIALGEEFDARDSMTLLWVPANHRTTRELAWKFATSHFDALIAKLPRDSGAHMPYLGGGFCDDAHRREVEAFFKSRAEAFTGGPRNLTQALEEISLCSASRAAHEPRVSAFLRKY